MSLASGLSCHHLDWKMRLVTVLCRGIFCPGNIRNQFFFFLVLPIINYRPHAKSLEISRKFNFPCRSNVNLEVNTGLVSSLWHCNGADEIHKTPSHCLPHKSCSLLAKWSTTGFCAVADLIVPFPGLHRWPLLAVEGACSLQPRDATFHEISCVWLPDLSRCKKIRVCAHQ